MTVIYIPPNAFISYPQALKCTCIHYDTKMHNLMTSHPGPSTSSPTFHSILQRCRSHPNSLINRPASLPLPSPFPTLSTRAKASRSMFPPWVTSYVVSVTLPTWMIWVRRSGYRQCCCCTCFLAVFLAVFLTVHAFLPSFLPSFFLSTFLAVFLSYLLPFLPSFLLTYYLSCRLSYLLPFLPS